MGSEVSKVEMSELETFWPRFRRSIKRKGKRQSSKPSHFSNHAAEISPTRLNSGISEPSVRIVSISREGELIPVIMSAAGKTKSHDQQSAKKKKKPLGFDVAEIKVKSHNAADISRESDVCSEELAPKQISKKEEKVSSRKLGRRLWVRIAQPFRFTTATDLHRTNRNRPKVSQDFQQGGHANYAPVIEQPKAQEIRSNNEVADSIPGPIDQASKSSRISAEVNSKSRKLSKYIDFHRKPSSHARTPNGFFKRGGIGSADTLSSSSSYPRPYMAATRNSSAPNNQLKNPNISTERKGTITGSLEDATGGGEGYDTAISLGVLIIIMGCLVLLSNRFVAVVCTSIWWFLLRSLLKKDRDVTTATAAGGGVNNYNKMRSEQSETKKT